MYASRIRAAGLVIAASLGLSACMSPYGYSSVGVGIGSGYGSYGYDGYGYGGYGGYGYPGGYGYGYPSYGWYDDFYYPGTGYYVYSRDGSRHRWTDSQRRYWESRRDRRRDGGLTIYQPTITTQATQSSQPIQTRRITSQRPERVERREVRRDRLRVKQESQRRTHDNSDD
jgi:hypothetical protein